jgi:hypothetical protein
VGKLIINLCKQVVFMEWRTEAAGKILMVTGLTT